MDGGGKRNAGYGPGFSKNGILLAVRKDDWKPVSTSVPQLGSDGNALVAQLWSEQKEKPASRDSDEEEYRNWLGFIAAKTNEGYYADLESYYNWMVDRTAAIVLQQHERQQSHPNQPEKADKKPSLKFEFKDLVTAVDKIRRLKRLNAGRQKMFGASRKTRMQLYFGSDTVPVALPSAWPTTVSSGLWDQLGSVDWKLPAAYHWDSFALEFSLLQSHSVQQAVRSHLQPLSRSGPKLGVEALPNLWNSTPNSVLTIADMEAEAKRSTQAMRDDIRSFRARQLESVAARVSASWKLIASVEIPNWYKSNFQRYSNMLAAAKRTAHNVRKEQSKRATNVRRAQKDAVTRAKRVARDLVFAWKRNEKSAAEAQRKVDKETTDRMRREEEEREATRQQKKLNFLLRQTEIFSHFMAKKVGASAGSQVSGVVQLEGTDEAEAQMEAARIIENHIGHLEEFDGYAEKPLDPHDSKHAVIEPEEPDMAPISLGDFKGELKPYQRKGVQWLVSLYDQGINGILADEMGLGKTIQTICFLNHLATVKGLWGPFLIIAPTATLHNWQQELARFCPSLRTLPYWGPARDRKILRRSWNDERLHQRNSPFHVVITSYKIVVDDDKYFGKLGWQYLVLDEAHAIKSSASQRWQTLLRFHSRNRLLLTGTPIQNNMAELWALLHFIMPTLFESHDEFAQWFAKDIEAQAVKTSKIRTDQVEKLQAILKPFMLRRIKRDVESEMAPKVELQVSCQLTPMQVALYEHLKKRILMQSKVTVAAQKDSELMNMVMQLRKVCNHPSLFEHEPVRSPLFMGKSDDKIELLVPRTVVLQFSTMFTPFDSLFSISPYDFFRARRLSTPPAESAFGTYRMPPAYVRHRVCIEDCCLQISDPRLQILSFVSYARKNAKMMSTRSDNGRDELPALRLSRSKATDISFTRETRAMYEDLLFVADAWIEEHTTRPSTIGVRKRARAEALSFCDDILTHLCTPKVQAYPARMIVSDRRFLVQSTCWLEQHPFMLSLLTSSLIPYGGTFRVNYRDAAFSHKDRITAVESLWPEVALGCRVATAVLNRRSHLIRFPSLRKLIFYSGKMIMIDRLLLRLAREGHRALVFCQMTRMMDILDDYFHARGYVFLRMDGSTAVSERRDRVHDFQTRDDIFLFMLSTRAGGLGITLTAADTVIFFDHDWNPTSDEQATDRAHRIGQTKQVTVYRLVARGTIEQRVMLRARQKRMVQAAVYDAGKAQQVETREESSGKREMIEFLLGDANDEDEATGFVDLDFADPDPDPASTVKTPKPAETPEDRIADRKRPLDEQDSAVSGPASKVARFS
eukprot:ANDGO_01406.mRNA.1 DNA helicase INO80